MVLGELSAMAAEFDPRTGRSSNTQLFTSNLPPHDVPPLFSAALRNRANTPTQTSLQGNGNGGITPTGAFDPFVTTPTPMTPGAVGPVSANPYSHDPTGAMGGAFFANQTGFQQPVRWYTMDCLFVGMSPNHSIDSVPSLCPNWPS